MTPPSIGVLLDFDGTVYVSDLPIQAYARRLAEQLAPDPARTLIAGMRQFLEGRAVPQAPDLDLSAAEDGYQAVELLAVAAGLDAGAISVGYRASRHDLAGSAFAVEPVAGLPELLTEWGDRAWVVLVTNADPPGVAEVLAATGLSDGIDEVITDAGKPDGWPRILDRVIDLVGDPARILAVGDRWEGDLAPTAARGGWTGWIDRFGRDATMNRPANAISADLATLLPALRARAAELLDRGPRA